MERTDIQGTECVEICAKTREIRSLLSMTQTEGKTLEEYRTACVSDCLTVLNIKGLQVQVVQPDESKGIFNVETIDERRHKICCFLDTVWVFCLLPCL